MLGSDSREAGLFGDWSVASFISDVDGATPRSRAQGEVSAEQTIEGLSICAHGQGVRHAKEQATRHSLFARGSFRRQVHWWTR